MGLSGDSPVLSWWQWDLVCESKTLKQVAQSIYMAGILLGSGLFGILSDK